MFIAALRDIKGCNIIQCKNQCTTSATTLNNISRNNFFGKVKNTVLQKTRTTALIGNHFT